LTFTDGTEYDDNTGEGDADKEANQAAFDAVENFLRLFDEDDYRTMFGDHVSVKVDRTGAETEEYSHD
jgi:hypothetical protein